MSKNGGFNSVHVNGDRAFGAKRFIGTETKPLTDEQERSEALSAVRRHPGVSLRTLALVATAPRGVCSRSEWPRVLERGLAALEAEGLVAKTKASGEVLERWWPSNHTRPVAAGEVVR